MKYNSGHLNVPINRIQEQSGFGLTVDVVVLGYDGELKVLAMSSDMLPFRGLPSLLGDVVNQNELLVDAASRTLENYTGIRKLALKQLGAFDQVNRHPLRRVITIGYYSFINLTIDKGPSIDNPNAFWVPIQGLGEMAFDHLKITRAAVTRLQENLDQSILHFDMLPDQFTLSDLQRLHEVILGQSLDKRNFRKRVMNQGIIQSTGKLQTNVSHRPAELFSINETWAQRTA